MAGLLPHTASGYALSISILIVLYFATTCIYNLYFHPLARFPGPRLAACTHYWHTIKKLSGKWPWINQELHEKYGDFVRISPNELSIIRPEALNDIYGHVKHGKQPFIKHDNYDQPGYPNILMVRDIPEHRMQRKALSNAFSAKSLHDQEHVVLQYANQFIRTLGKWSSGPQGLDIVKGLNWVTFDIIGDLCFGESFGSVKAGDTHPWVFTILDSLRALNVMNLQKKAPLLFLLLPFWVPRDLGEKMKSNRQYSIEKMKKRIEQKDSITRTDFFKHILDKDILPWEGLVSNAEILVLAGSESTSTTLSGILFYLSRNPDALSKLKKEVRSAFSSFEEINGDNASRLPYLHAVLEEGLRIYPAVPMGLRRVSPGAGICGKYVPANTVVSVPPWAITRDKRFWKDPSSFCPERWIEGSEGFEQDNKNASYPFSLGSRGCLGVNLAWIELHIILAKLIFVYDWELIDVDPDWVEKGNAYPLWHKPELKARFYQREDVIL